MRVLVGNQPWAFTSVSAPDRKEVCWSGCCGEGGHQGVEGRRPQEGKSAVLLQLLKSQQPKELQGLAV